MKIKLKKIKDDCYHLIKIRKMKRCVEMTTYELDEEELKDFVMRLGLNFDDVKEYLEKGEITSG